MPERLVIERIQQRYYAPNLSFVWSSTSGRRSDAQDHPAARHDRRRGAATVSLAAAAALISSRYHLQRKVGSAAAGRTSRCPSPGAEVRRLGQGRGQVPLPGPRQGLQGPRGPWAYSAKRRAAVRGPVGTTCGRLNAGRRAGDRSQGSRSRATRSHSCAPTARAWAESGSSSAASAWRPSTSTGASDAGTSGVRQELVQGEQPRRSHQAGHPPRARGLRWLLRSSLGPSGGRTPPP